MKLHRLIFSKLYRRMDALKAENEKLKGILTRQLDHVSLIEYVPEKSSPLYFRDQPLFLPGDKVMVPYVLRNGVWDEGLLDFARTSLAAKPGVSYFLIDIGANVGLVTRQFLTQFPAFVGATCVEPDPDHFAFLQKNDSIFDNVQFLNYALSDTDGTSTFYRDAGNIGRRSLLESNIQSNSIDGKITVHCLKVTDDLLLKGVPANAKVFWKSDTEGYDEIIVTALSLKFWERVDFAIMELLRTPKPKYDTGKFEAVLDSFPHKAFSTDPGSRVSTADILAFLRGEELAHCNLYLSR